MKAVLHGLVPGALVLLLLSVGSICDAAGEIHPRLLVRQEYNDNVFLSRWSLRQSDWITVVEPGVAAAWQKRLLRLEVDYRLHFRRYDEFSQLDETRLRDAQRALATAEFFPGRPFTLTISDEFSRVAIDSRAPLVEENASLNRTNRNRLLVSPRYAFERQVWSAVVGYHYEDLYYEAAEGDDSRAHRATVDLRRTLSPRLVLFSALAGEDRRLERSQDFRRGDASVGATWTPSSRLALTANGGLTWLAFEDQEMAGPPRDDRRTTSWSLRGSWQVRPALTAAAAYGEAVELSVNRGLFESRTADASLAHVGKMTTTLRLFAREDNYIDSKRLDRAAGFNLGIGVPLGKTLALALNANVERLAFHPGDEDVWRCRGLAALNYTGRRLTATVGYNVNAQDSDVDANDYLNNVLYVQAGMKF